jgi:hypothetical protein
LSYPATKAATAAIVRERLAAGDVASPAGNDALCF